MHADYDHGQSRPQLGFLGQVGRQGHSLPKVSHRQVYSGFVHKVAVFQACARVLLERLLASHLLMSPWPQQVTGTSPKSTWEGVHKGVNTERRGSW